MSIFKKKEKLEEKTMREITQEALDLVEKTSEQLLKASGMSMTDMVRGLDKESGAMLGITIEAYQAMVQLALDQADVIDRMEKSLNQANERLIHLDTRLDGFEAKLLKK